MAMRKQKAAGMAVTKGSSNLQFENKGMVGLLGSVSV